MVSAVGEVFEARVGCEDVVRASFRLIDEGQARASADLYTADATLVMNSAGETRLQGDQIRQAMHQREQAVRATAHVVSPLSFELVGPDGAECDCYLQVYALESEPTAPPRLQAVSRFHDVLVRAADGRWRIAARRITVLAGGR